MAIYSSILAGEVHGKRRLEGYGPRDPKELHMTGQQMLIFTFCLRSMISEEASERLVLFCPTQEFLPSAKATTCHGGEV